MSFAGPRSCGSCRPYRQRAAFRGEEARRTRLVAALRQARLTGIRVPREARAAAGERLALPRLIVDAGPVAVARFLEFFAARIANRRTESSPFLVETLHGP